MAYFQAIPVFCQYYEKYRDSRRNCVPSCTLAEIHREVPAAAPFQHKRM